MKKRRFLTIEDSPNFQRAKILNKEAASYFVAGIDGAMTALKLESEGLPKGAAITAEASRAVLFIRQDLCQQAEGHLRHAQREVRWGGIDKNVR